MTVKRIVPNLACADPKTVQGFYIDVLGLEVAMDLGWVVTLTSKETPAAQLSLLKIGSSEPQPDYSVEVTDIDECYRRAEVAGFKILYPLTHEPWGVRRFFLRDPTGKIANVMQHA